MTGVRADLAHALRIYGRTPVASVLAVAVLAIAMAFVISFLSLFMDLTRATHPGFEDSVDIVTVGQTDGTTLNPMSPALIERINDESNTLTAAAGFQTMWAQLGPEREQRTVEMVSDGFFSGLKPRLALGRGFNEIDHDPAAAPVAVISYAYWQERYGGDASVLGRTLSVTGRRQYVDPEDEDAPPSGVPETSTIEFQIVGVMSAALPSLQAANTDAWLPLEIGGPLLMEDWEGLRTAQILRTIARRAGGANPGAIAAELDTRFADEDDLGVQPGGRFAALQGVVLNLAAERNSRRQLALFLAGSMLVALVASANVSLFLMSRAPGRRRELAIRVAVGAPIRRLARQLASEAALLVLAATGLGLLASFWLRSLLKGLAFLQEARWHGAAMLDWRVAAIVVAMLGVLIALVSIAPVRGLGRVGIAAESRRMSTRANLTQRLACTAQVAIAGTVAAVAISFGWYLLGIVSEDHAYDVSNVHLLTFGEDETSSGFFSFGGFDAARVERERRRDRIGAVPGIAGVAFASAAPSQSSIGMSFGFPSPDDPAEQVTFNVVSADRQYFELLGIDPVGGRLYGGDEADVLIVSETAAQAAWGRVDVVGETLPVELPDVDSLEVVAVVPDVPYGHPEATPEARAYLPVFPFVGIDFILIRSELPTSEVRSRVQGLVDSGNLDGAIRDIEFLPDRVSNLLAADRARSLMTLGSAALVLLLAGFGFYGTQRFLVAAGRREYAIRASLGAGPSRLARLVMRRGLYLGLPGIALGTVGGFIAAVWLRSDFVSRDVLPGVVTAFVVAGLIALLMAASLGPARQARATQPALLLRQE